MAVTIQTKHEDGDATDVPSTLSEGELAVNTQAQKLWVGPIGGGTPVPLLGGPLGGGTADGQTLRWEADSSAWEATSNLVVADSGNVGIGTASPARALEVVGTTATTASLSSNQTQAALAFKDSGTSLIGSVKIGSESEGMFFNAASVERMRITSDGNVGIGTDAPVSDLEVEKAGGATIRVGTDLGQDLILSANASAHVIGTPNTSIPLTFTTADTERVRIDSAGNVGIGTIIPQVNLNIEGTDFGKIRLSSSGGALGVTYGGEIRGEGASGLGGQLRLGVIDNSAWSEAIHISQGADFVRFLTSPTGAGNEVERVRIDASGNLLVGKTSAGGWPTQGFEVKSSGQTSASTTSILPFIVHRLGTAGDSINVYQASVASARVDSGGNWIPLSDARYKEDVADLAVGLAEINQLRPVSFTWNTTGVKESAGLIAQEVDSVVSGFTSVADTENKEMGVKYTQLIPVLVKAIQEITTRLEALEA